jgi:spoIIIJ-associated protein
MTVRRLETDTIDMEWVETTGRTLEEALDAALDELGVDEADVEYEIIEQPRSGLFGRLGGAEARIRARVKPLSREKPGERQHRNRRSGASSRAQDVRTGGVATSAPESAEASNGFGGAASREGRGAPPAAAGAAGAPGSPARKRRRRTRRPSGAKAGQGSPTNGSAEERASTTNKGTAVDTETSHEEVSIEEQAAAAETFTRGLVDAFELGAEVRGLIVDDGIVVDVTGQNLGLLVGPRGATLNAIEELVRTVVQRQTDGHGVRINVDVGGYRAKRREALEQFTRELAAKVVDSGRAQALEPMSASDRKVVHDVAAEINGVMTESEGEEPRRRVVLLPATESG